MASVKLFVILTLFLINMPELCLAVDMDNATCSYPLEVNTNTVYFYRYLDIFEGFKQIKFDVKASNDVHLALFPVKGSSEHYEIVLGAGRNSHSAIRRCALCSNKADVLSYGIVSQFEYRRFWIIFGCNGTIGIGRNDDTMPFLQWTDPNPLDVKYLGYSTGWGSTGEFRFCKFGAKHEFGPENIPLFLSCTPESVIYTVNAFYGYNWMDCETTNTSTGGSTEERQRCFAQNSKQIVSSACDRQQYCVVSASNEVFGNMCVQTPKYLGVIYLCIPNTYFTSPPPSPSSSPHVTPPIVSTEVTPTTGNIKVDVSTSEEQNPNHQQVYLAEKVPVWPIVTICLVGFILLLTGAIILLWKITQRNRSGRGIMQMHRLT